MLPIPPTIGVDEIERQLPDVAAARAQLGAHAEPIDLLGQRQRERLRSRIAGGDDEALLERTLGALLLAYARMTFRHGRLGHDLHAYHNEGHIKEICGVRFERLLDSPGAQSLSLRDCCALLLFGAGHDLRQREAGPPSAGVGANELASLLEMARILDVCGFDREGDLDLHLALELAIAGSTFDAAPLPGALRLNAADLVQSGGALAPRLGRILDDLAPDWREDARIVHARKLALLAADLDTANVAEPFAEFAASGERLCREREMLSGRSLSATDSALPVLSFLSDGQLRFFFELHDFHSTLGRAAFEPAKRVNAPLLRALAIGLRARVAVGVGASSGEQVLEAYHAAIASVLTDAEDRHAARAGVAREA